MGSRSADKIKFRSFDGLFGEQEPKGVEKETKGTVEDQVVRMVLTEFHPFKGHPFRVMEEEEMMEMVITDIQAKVFDFRKNRVVPFAVKRLEFSFGNGRKTEDL